MIYQVTFSYTINVEADDEVEAETKAYQEYIEIEPKLEEMNVTCEERGEHL